MIEPITPNMKEWHDNLSEFPGTTKFIGEDGSGHRGTIIELRNNATEAMILGTTGEYFRKLVRVKETHPDAWPVFVKEETP